VSIYQESGLLHPSLKNYSLMLLLLFLDIVMNFSRLHSEAIAMSGGGCRPELDAAKSHEGGVSAVRRVSCAVIGGLSV
jgi:hypothetical protein